MFRVTDTRALGYRLSAQRDVAEQLSPARWAVDGARRCEAPILIEWSGRDYRDRPVGIRSLLVDQWVNCRRCASCLARRAAAWRIRSLIEVRRAIRTWFVTLTLAPQEHYLAECRARRRLADRAVRYDDLSDQARFTERHREIGTEITKYLKRLRKQGRCRFRYIIVAERHKSGLPHYHLLVHELEGERPLRHVLMKQQWRLGFGAWKLIKSLDVARYVTKYLSKSVEARVRASQRYGMETEDLDVLLQGSILNQDLQTITSFKDELGVWVGSEAALPAESERSEGGFADNDKNHKIEVRDPYHPPLFPDRSIGKGYSLEGEYVRSV